MEQISYEEVVHLFCKIVALDCVQKNCIDGYVKERNTALVLTM